MNVFDTIAVVTVGESKSTGLRGLICRRLMSLDLLRHRFIPAAPANTCGRSQADVLGVAGGARASWSLRLPVPAMRLPSSCATGLHTLSA